MKNYLVRSILFLSISGLVFSCTKDEINPDLPSKNEDYTIALQVLGSNDEAADYLVQAESLSEGTITSEGQGIEQTGWRYFVQVDKSMFSIGYYDDNNCIGYQLDDNGDLVEYGRFVFEKTLDCMAPAGNNTLLAFEVPRTGDNKRVLHVVDVESVSLDRKIETDIYKPEGDTLPKWPTGMVVKGDKLFVSFYPVSPSGDFSTPSVDTAQVAVLSYPDLEFEKVISDTRTSPVGVYGNATGLLETGNGDLYTFSSSSLAGGFSKQTKPSGILRIKRGLKMVLRNLIPIIF